MHTKFIIIFSLILSGLLGFLISYHIHQPTASSIQLTQTVHYPALFVQQIQNDPQAGEKIYKEFCASCHNPEPVIDVHAPSITDKKTWRLLKKQGMSQLLKITTQGLGAMPARGGCFECSDEQLKKTIEYIINH